MNSRKGYEAIAIRCRASDGNCRSGAAVVPARSKAGLSPAPAEAKAHCPRKRRRVIGDKRVSLAERK